MRRIANSWRMPVAAHISSQGGELSGVARTPRRCVTAQLPTLGFVDPLRVRTPSLFTCPNRLSLPVMGPLGMGGMGVIYKAETSTWTPHVALKFLPRTFSQDPQALQPFSARSQIRVRAQSSGRFTIYEMDEARRAGLHRHGVAGRPDAAGRRWTEDLLQTDKVLDLGAQIASAGRRPPPAG